MGARVRYCRKEGHDTWLHGRSNNGRCYLCYVQGRREYDRSEKGRAAKKRGYEAKKEKRKANPKRAIEVPNLRAVRHELGLTLHQMSAATGIDVMRLWHAERGSKMRPHNIERLLRGIEQLRREKVARYRRKQAGPNPAVVTTNTERSVSAA